MPTVTTRTGVLVVRHERESWKSTGTARIAGLAMPNLRILEFGENSEPARTALPELVGAGTHLLFPTDESAPWDGSGVSDSLRLGASSASLQLPSPTVPPDQRRSGVTRLVVLDGTWRQVRRMYAKLPALHAVPKLALPEQATKILRLRDSKFEAGRSTLEAIAEAIALLEGDAVAAPLHALHALYVERVFRARGVWGQKSGAVEP